jgi:hypothetical protein
MPPVLIRVIITKFTNGYFLACASIFLLSVCINSVKNGRVIKHSNIIKKQRNAVSEKVNLKPHEIR